MFSSIKLRLTLWYVTVFGVLLIAFSMYLYSSVAGDLRMQFDVSLQRIAYAMTTYFTEFSERKNIIGGAKETVREVGIGHLSSAIYHDGQLLAIAGPDKIPAAWAQEVSKLRTGDAAIFLTQADSRRLVALPCQIAGENYVVAVVEPLDQLNRQLQRIRNIVFVALPAALILAAAGGFLLAHYSLQPVVTISKQAEHIGARNLHERLRITSHDELGRLATVINALLSRLDHSFRIMREFMADAAHELRTPLAIIQGEADVSLSRPRTAEEYRESIGVMRGNCKRLVHIVSDMLALARADTGEQPLQLEELYLNDLVEGCCRSAQPLARAQGVNLNYDSNGDIPFFGDEELLKRMTVNLIDNAIRYTPAGGSVSVKVDREDIAARLLVSDTGIGIPGDSLNRVFDRFYRVAKSRARADGGSGLGLSIVKLAAEAHRGSVEVASELGAGSTFTVFLPLGRT
jgi:heavy metal sensor kinase